MARREAHRPIRRVLQTCLRGWLLVLEAAARVTAAAVATVLGLVAAFYFVVLPLSGLRWALQQGAWGEAAGVGAMALVSLALAGWVFAHLAGVVAALRYLGTDNTDNSEVSRDG